VYEKAGDVASRVGVIEGAVSDVAIGVVIMAVEGIAEEGIGGEEVFLLGVVDTALHIDQAVVVIHFVAGESVGAGGGGEGGAGDAVEGGRGAEGFVVRGGGELAGAVGGGRDRAEVVGEQVGVVERGAVGGQLREGSVRAIDVVDVGGGACSGGASFV